MSILMVNEWADFNSLKETLNITDGNLASHINALEKMDFVKIKKQFVGKKTNTSYSISRAGKKAFNDHLDALENLLKKRS